jgi:cyclic pyranopterin monophosphate synthase
MADFSHFDQEGNVRMVDISAKGVTFRSARAVARLTMLPETGQKLKENDLKKGNALATARVAGISAAKRTSDLIPLCHPLRLDGIDIAFEFVDPRTLQITAEVRATDRTGVEMEALTAASVAALTCYDMCKGIDRGMTIRDISLQEKQGGTSGHYLRPTDEPMGERNNA